MAPTIKFNENRKFGVEIEFIGVNRHAVVSALREAGLEASVESYGHSNVTYWKVQPDGSCESELVSPPLKGSEGLVELKTALKALESVGAKTDKRCGLHVHHDANDYDGDDLRNLLMLYIKFEPVLDRLLPKSRRDNTASYCQSMILSNYRRPTQDYVARQRQEFTLAKLGKRNGMQVYRDIFGRGTRFQKLNFTSYERQGTVEFRHHSGTIDFAKIQAWIILTQIMVERAKFARIRNAGAVSFHSFKWTLGMIGNTQTTRIKKMTKFMSARFRHFTRKDDTGYKINTDLRK